ncbi:MAG: S41 family peptidase [Candidatus Sungbacteria bacterium]|nr:S41 family peptidase [Candidatus Sungbacteria bacterium]
MPRLDWRKYTRVYIFAAALLFLGVSFFAGAVFGYSNRPSIDQVLNVLGKAPPPEFKETDFSLFWDVWSRLEDKHVEKSHIDRQKLVYGAIQGLVKSLKDPYTEFFPPAETKQFRQDIRGSFDGIGAEIGLRKGILTIIAPLKNSPAEHAGIKSGDKIFKINDTITADLQLDEAVRMIRGEKGTAVLLVVVRDGLDKPKEFKIIRDTIKVQIITTEKRPDGIFVIKLHHFSESAADEFKKAIQEFYDSKSQKLVLDVRNNPGGFLAVAVDIASWFLPAGDIVVRERFADGSQEMHRSQGYRILQQIPAVVLVNEGSASASEILAGALRDHNKTKLIGTKTFGKGSVQEVEELPGDSSLKVTIAKWLTPHGTEIDGKGLEPDIVIQPKEDEDPLHDPVMDKAIEILKQTN